MPKLTQEHIRFIDDYLYNAGVHYVDIRYEMTDHVAAAIENMDGDFGENFSAYMLRNKEELLKSNRSFKQDALMRSGKLLLANFMRLPLIIITGILFFLAFLLSAKIGYDEVFTWFMILQVSMAVIFYGMYIYYWLVSKDKYSVVSRLLLLSYLIPIVFRLEKFIDKNNILMMYYCIYTSLMIGLAFTIVQLHQKYKLQYNG